MNEWMKRNREWISEESDDFANPAAVFTLSAAAASAAAKQKRNQNKHCV